MSWDEATIGLWCRFTRSPDVYNAGFWRLLQAPYYRKPLQISRVANGLIRKESVVGDILETYGDQADRIMRRNGLYCVGCDHSTYETIELGARQHGIDAMQLDHLIQELNQTLAPVVIGSKSPILSEPE